ncbi:hypothetical protein EVAR_50276_1 [Eumeta japonica]|uniref:Uncharacterized protein n=1 Tax=Eumeta variegata TaxID=151549 RepID=A0A4C1Y634_EUMVA|nr:hypothetical protein EVAR_50276_1 [Eumeta japonica]
MHVVTSNCGTQHCAWSDMHLAGFLISIPVKSYRNLLEEEPEGAVIFLVGCADFEIHDGASAESRKLRYGLGARADKRRPIVLIKRPPVRCRLPWIYRSPAGTLTAGGGPGARKCPARRGEIY